VIVTGAPTGPDVTDRLVMLGATVTVNGTPLLADPSTVTTTGPVVAPVGTFNVILVALQVVAVPAFVPLNVTALVPWLDPKLLPMIITDVRSVPDVTDRLVILGATVTVNGTPLLADPPTVTTTGPVAAPVGTFIVMLVAFQVIAVPAFVPLKVTVLLPWLDPKLLPVIVTGVPTEPDVADRLVMLGGTVTVNGTPLLADPPTVTTTGPVVAPVGTFTVMLVALQVVAVPAFVPLKVTVFVPWLDPKLVPVIVTGVFTGPDGTDRLVMLGATLTVNGTPLLAKPPTVTTTGPLVAPAGTFTVILVGLQVVAAPAFVPLRVTVLVPWLDPKLLPVIVTGVPTAPDVGDRVVMAGAGDVTVKFMPLLAKPPTVTTTGPLLAPVGTFTVMLVALQVVAVPALVPLKVTVLVPWLDPRLVPVIVTGVPTGPDPGDRLVMPGANCDGPLSGPNAAKVEGELWLLYWVWIQSAERAVFDILTSSK